MATHTECGDLHPAGSSLPGSLGSGGAQKPSTSSSSQGFDLGPSSLKSLVLKKQDTSRSKNLKRIAERADLSWLWDRYFSEVDYSYHKRFLYDETNLDDPPVSPDRWLIDLTEAYVRKLEDEWIVLLDTNNERVAKFKTKARGTKSYSAEVIEKKERLEDWIESKYSRTPHIMFLTFTLSSDRVSDTYESLQVMKEAVNHITSQLQLKKHLDYRPDYIWAIEPHESGYVHLHLVVFADWIPNIEDLAEWWSENYTSGSAGYQGLDWERVKTRRVKNEGMVAGYITKYVIKFMTGHEFDNCDQKEKDLRLFWLGILWLSGRRSWSYSRFIGRVLSGLVLGSSISTDPDGADPLLACLLAPFGGASPRPPPNWQFLGTKTGGEIARYKRSGRWSYSQLEKELDDPMYDTPVCEPVWLADLCVGYYSLHFRSDIPSAGSSGLVFDPDRSDGSTWDLPDRVERLGFYECDLCVDLYGEDHPANNEAEYSLNLNGRTLYVCESCLRSLGLMDRI